jgi:hypothetical protein
MNKYLVTMYKYSWEDYTLDRVIIKTNEEVEHEELENYCLNQFNEVRKKNKEEAYTMKQVFFDIAELDDIEIKSFTKEQDNE